MKRLDIFDKAHKRAKDIDVKDDIKDKKRVSRKELFISGFYEGYLQALGDQSNELYKQWEKIL